MSNEPITLSYRHPAMIDADTPAEVRTAVLAQLTDLAPKLRTLVEASSKQIRNAQLDDFLAECGGNLDLASIKLTDWENGDAAASVDRLFRLGVLLEQAARAVAEQCEPNED